MPLNLTIVAIGRLKERFWKEAYEEYAKRLGAYAKLDLREIPDRDPAKVGGEAKGVDLECADVLAAIPDRAHVVLLDIGGKLLSSPEIAARLDDMALYGQSDVWFVIGGSCGVNAQVRARADERWSFGRITMPHNMARVVLAEQLYRAFRISRNEPYHK